MNATRRALIALKTCFAGLAVALACAALAQSATKADAMDDGLRAQYAISLEPRADRAQWSLRGVDGRRGVEFGIREDERVKGLELDLAYIYSAALLKDLSHLNVILNREVVASLPFAQTPSSSLNQMKVALPVKLLQPYNLLELQLIGHYTMGCEDPSHVDLWTTIEKTSRLLFDVERVALPDDLALLPQPFFDPRDMRAQKMQFVLGQPSDSRLASAGVLASWLGALTAYRGVEFTVNSDSIPQQGHAIIVLDPDTPVPGLSLPKIQGPTLAMRTNPHDPAGKLLIVAGRDDEEIHRAAVSLVLGGQTLSGATAHVTAIDIEPREPYDAPNWMPTNRPVSLGEMLPVQEFTVSGFDPQSVTVPLRLPPDLSDWRNRSALLNLYFRHSPVRAHDDATLDVRINHNLVQKIKLTNNTLGILGFLSQEAAVVHQTVNLPLSMLESQAQLGFKFRYPEPYQIECRGNVLDARYSAIDPRSTIDLSGLAHHIGMPDLAAFRTSGFPFSRMADLSQTLVLLSRDAQQDEFATFLALLGNIGQATGYPATGVTVQREAVGLENKDLLVINAGSSSEILSNWVEYLPQDFKEEEDVSWLAELTQRVLRNPFISANARPVPAPSGGAYVVGFESPVTSGRSVVVVAGSDGASLQKAVQLILSDESQSDQFQGSLALVQDGRIKSLSAATSYYVGSLGMYRATLWFFSRYPVVLFLILLVGAMLTSIVLYLSLRARAQRRLRTGLSDTQESCGKE